MSEQLLFYFGFRDKIVSNVKGSDALICDRVQGNKGAQGEGGGGGQSAVFYAGELFNERIFESVEWLIL